MPGEGKTPKPYHVNTARESTYGQEGSTKRAFPGAISERPKFDPHNETIKTSKHDEPGEIYKALKGKFIGKIPFKYSIEDFRHLAHCLGGIIDRERVLELGTGDVSTFQADELVTGGTSSAKAKIESITDDDLYLYQFSEGETITGGTSGATGTLDIIRGNKMHLSAVSGTFQANEELTGGTSGAKAQSDSFADPIITLKDFQDGETVTGGTSSDTGTIADIVYRHQIYSKPNYIEGQTLFYKYDSLPNQHLLTGCVCTSWGIESSTDGDPKASEEWAIGAATTEAKDNDYVSQDLDLYEYIDIDLTVNSTDYSALFKTLSIQIQNGVEPNNTHDSLNPSGMSGANVVTQVSFGIHRSNVAQFDLRENNTRFPTTVTCVRGTAGKDDATFTFANCKSLKPSEAGDKSIFIDMELDIEGTPTIDVNDLIQKYD